MINFQKRQYESDLKNSLKRRNSVDTRINQKRPSLENSESKFKNMTSNNRSEKEEISLSNLNLKPQEKNSNKCSSCGTFNSKESIKCIKCQKLLYYSEITNSSNYKTYSESDINIKSNKNEDSGKIIFKNNDGTLIKCSYCGNQNKPKKINCRICNSPLEKISGIGEISSNYHSKNTKLENKTNDFSNKNEINNSSEYRNIWYCDYCLKLNRYMKNLCEHCHRDRKTNSDKSNSNTNKPNINNNISNLTRSSSVYNNHSYSTNGFSLNGTTPVKKSSNNFNPNVGNIHSNQRILNDSSIHKPIIHKDNNTNTINILNRPAANQGVIDSFKSSSNSKNYNLNRYSKKP